MSTDKAQQQTAKHRVKPWKVVVGLTLVLPFVAIQWLLHSSYFVRVIIDQVQIAVPELDIENLSGNVAEGLRLDAYYSDGVNNYVINDLNITVTVSCLFRLQLCVNSLYIDNVDINLSTPAKPAEAAKPIALPTIVLPINIVIDDLRINTLHVNNNATSVYSVNSVYAKLALRESELEIANFRAQDDYCNWNLDGEIILANAYPISADVGCQSVERFGEFQLALSDTVENLTVNGNLKPQHPMLQQNPTIQIDYTIQPLQPSLPMSLMATLENTAIISVNDETITLKHLVLNAKGENLVTDILLNGALSHSRWPGEHLIETDALVDAQHLEIKRLNWLLPQGKVSAVGNLQFSDAISWDGDVNWDTLDLAYWQQTVTGQLSGAMHTQVTYDDALFVAADIDGLSGRINDQTVDGDGTVIWQQNQLEINQAQLTVGGGRLSISGVTNFEDITADTRFNIPNINHWLPDLIGGLSGQLAVRGKLTDPSIKGQVVTKNLNYQNILTDDITADVDWRAFASIDNRITIKASTVQQGAFYGSADIAWQGSLADHRWQLQVQGKNNHTDKNLAANCTGSWQPPAWSTHCDTLSLTFDYFDTPQRWQLSAPLDISLNTQTQYLALAAFCLVNQSQRLCNNKEINLTAQNPGTITLQANNMSSQWLQPWLPANMQVSGSWDAALAIDDPFQQQTLSADINANELGLQYQQGEKPPLTVQFQALELAWQWLPPQHQHQVSWQFDTRSNGNSRGNFTLSESKLEGQMSLSQWQLAAFSRFLMTDPKEQLEGVVNSQINLTGTLERPLINGNLSFNQGAVKANVLPVPINNIDLNLNVVNNTAKLDGKFTANNSPGQLGGEFTWTPEDWNAELTLKADDLAYQPDRNIQVHVAPDVNLKLTPTLVSLTGDVRVPRANAKIEQLPPQAATVSADTVIVGNETTTQSQVVKTDLRLILGDDVNFEGFGLTTKITGNLRLQQNPGELLRGQGRLKLVEGRYKKYGQDLIIENGDLIFVNDLENPQLRLEAIRDPEKTADDVRVGLLAYGSAREPKINLFSDPSKSQQEQMSYLIYGVAPDTDRETDASAIAAQQALSYALSSSAGESLTRFAGQTLGIEDLQVTTDTNNQGTQIGLRGYLTPNLMVRYGVGVFDTVNSLTLQYQLNKNVYLEAVSSKSSALDLFWKFEKD